MAVNVFTQSDAFSITRTGKVGSKRSPVSRLEPNNKVIKVIYLSVKCSVSLLLFYPRTDFYFREAIPLRLEHDNIFSGIRESSN